MPHPENDSDTPKTKRRRPSHFRKRRKDNTTKVLRVQQGSNDSPRDPRAEAEAKPDVRWADVANDPPSLPDPPLHRRVPPPAPLPAEQPTDETLPSVGTEEQQRLRRIEETVGVVGLAILVAAMVVAMWLRMTGG